MQGESTRTADDRMQDVNIYIGTSIRGPNKGGGSYMYLLEVRLRSGENADAGRWAHMEEATENRLAVSALEEALGRMTRPCRLTIWTECPYLASALENRWYEKWENNEWKTAKGEPVSEAEKWRSIQYLLGAHEFQVRLREHHAYTDWMRREIRKREDAKAAGAALEK